MKRIALTASLTSSAAAAALMAAALASPASAQMTTYPKGTDCSVIQNTASRADCINQQSQSQTVPNSGQMAPTTNGASQNGSQGLPISQTPGMAGASQPGIPGGGPTSGRSTIKQ